jgi:two-component system NtrC family sensor kinase
MILIGVAAIGPLTMLGIGAARVSESRLKDEVTSSQARTVDQIAQYIDLWMTLELRMLNQQSKTFDLGHLGDRDLARFQRLVFQQASSAQIVGVINREGAELAPSLYLTQPATGRLSSKNVVTPARFAQFRRSLPLGALQRWLAADRRERRLVVGKPYTAADSETPLLPVIVPSDLKQDLHLATELSLDLVHKRFEQAAESGLEVALIDRDGDSIIHLGGSGIESKRFEVFLAGSACDMVEYTAQDGSGVFAACAPVGRAGWLVVVAEPSATFSQAQSDIQDRTLYIACIAAILAIILGGAFSSSMVRPVVDLKSAAFKVSEGELGTRVTPDGPEEIRDLSRAFNFMSARLQRNQDELEANREAIGAFNLELQRQLDAQAIELNDANRRLLQSARLAAVGEMGAGLAHELNNPLAGILGLVQVLQSKSEHSAPMLQNIEGQARRCSQIVAHLLRFSRGERPSGPVDQADWAVIDLDEVVAEVVTLMAGASKEVGVSLTHQRTSGLQVRCDREALGTAVAQLMTSLRAACTQGGSIALLGSVDDGKVRYRISVKGEALDLSTDAWMATGMGFWFARQVLAAHGGGLREPTGTLSDRSAEWSFVLPRAG